MHNGPSSLRSQRQNQTGAALMIALILLIVITLVGLAAIGTTILQNKAAANEYDRQIAFQSAEAALRAAQVTITTAAAGSGVPISQTALTTANIEDCSPAYNATPTVCPADAFNDPNATAYVTSVPASAYSAGPVAAAPPQYIIQYLGEFIAPDALVRSISPPPYGMPGLGQTTNYFRITARSGAPAIVSGRAIVTLQSTFRN